MKPTRKKHSSGVNAEEIELFREAIGEVDPIVNQKVIVAEPSKKSRPQHALNQTFDDYLNNDLSDGFALNEPIEQGESISYLKPSIQPNILSKLKRGQFSIAASLDLHGMTIDEARHNISAFFNQQRREVRCCVRIVHGKGNRSLGQIPVLKRMVNHWLPQRADVIAFCSTPTHDGGTGAIYVLLQKA